MSGTIIVGVILGLVVSFFVAREFYKASVARGWPQKKYFWICVLLPIIGYLLIIALPDRGGPALGSFVSDDLPEL